MKPGYCRQVNYTHDLMLFAGALGLASIFAGLVSARFNAPLLLVFLGIGMLAGEDGPGGVGFSDFGTAYLVGSIALATILFAGGLETKRSMLRAAFWPAALMATGGVVITTAIVAAAAVWLFDVPWVTGLAIGAALAPTDAAAVNLLLRRAQAALPHRVTALLEVESGLNDPMSVFLMIALVPLMITPEPLHPAAAALLLVEEMGGGAVLGLAGGFALLALLRRLSADAPIFPVMAFFAIMMLFGLAQTLGASGFLAVYLMGMVVGTHPYRERQRLEQFYDAFAWIAQIALFLMLGLLVTPHDLLPAAPAILAMSAVLILVARPVAAFACLLPFGFSLRETSFASWVGLRGAVPIFLTIIPVLQGVQDAQQLFGVAFGIVVTSLVVQGWTIGHAARLLGFGRRAETP